MPRFPRSLNPSLATGSLLGGQEQAALRDIVWDRPIFRAPALPNPRVVFDPLPFRTQLFNTARRVYRLAKR